MRTRLTFCLCLLASAVHAQTTLSLDDALAQAVKNREVVAAARLRLDQARLSRRALGAFPSTTFLLGRSSDLEVGGHDDDLGLNQPIDIFGRTSAARSSGDALVLQAEASLRQSLAELQDDVITLYGDTAAAGERVRIARESEAIAARLLDAIKGLVEGGKVPGVQATRVSIELERSRAARLLREAQWEAVKTRLAAAIGGKKEDLKIPEFALIAFSQDEAAKLVQQRPELLLLEADVKAAEAQARISRTNRLPQLDFQVRRTPWQQADAKYGVRLQLSFPLFDSGRASAETGAANKRAEAARRVFADTARIARADLDAARVEVEAAGEQVSRLQAVLKMSEDLAARTQAGLKEGANTLLDVLDALRALREIEEGLVDAKLSLAQAQARRLKASGRLLEGVR